MSAWVLLLRGVNVGGRNVLPMADLRGLLAGLGAGNVATYIQSGNAVFTGGVEPQSFAQSVARAIEETFGFRPDVMVLDASDLSDALSNFPFPEAFDTPKTGHIWFCAAPPSAPDLARIDSLAAPTERFALIGAIFALYAPDGIGRSKLAAGVERALGVAATARNLNTVKKLADMAAALPD